MPVPPAGGFSDSHAIFRQPRVGQSKHAGLRQPCIKLGQISFPSKCPGALVFIEKLADIGGLVVRQIAALRIGKAARAAARPVGVIWVSSSKASEKYCFNASPAARRGFPPPTRHVSKQAVAQALPSARRNARPNAQDKRLIFALCGANSGGSAWQHAIIECKASVCSSI